MMDDIRTSLKAIQWERAKGELRAFAALAGSFPSDGANPYDSPNYRKWKGFEAKMDHFIRDIESHGYQE